MIQDMLIYKGSPARMIAGGLYMPKKYTKEDCKRAFLEKIEKDPNGCWNWKAGIKRFGYGRATYLGKNDQGAHRVSWLIFRGEIPKGMLVCHKCDNRKCVKPSHLFLGTHQDNMDDGVKKKRFLHGEARRKANNPRRGQAHHHAILTPEKVLEIIELKKQGKSYTEITSLIGVNKGTACDIICGRTWKHITGIENEHKSAFRYNQETIDKVVELRQKGLWFWQIGHLLGISKGVAHKIYHRGIRCQYLK